MVLGNFIAQVYIKGVANALVEALLNFVQIAVGGIVGIPLSAVIRRYLVALR